MSTELFNRPGLPEVAYRSARHGEFLDEMLATLSSAALPALSRLGTRDRDDPTIALLDAWAVACDVLTFYNERLFNEVLLRTAVERTSLQELGKLVAYRLNAGVAAETYLAFTLERPPPTPSNLPPDPGLLPPTTPAVVLLDAGLRVQSVPGPGDKPQTFETVEAIEARPEWNALPAVRTKPYPPVFGRVDAWLAGTTANLRRGDALLFASRDLEADRWDVRLLTDVDPDPVADHTHVRWDRGLGSWQPPNQPPQRPDVYVFRKRIPLFGHNAPVWRAMNAQFREGYATAKGGTGDQPEWQNFAAVTTPGGVITVDLDGTHPDVVQGSWVVVSQETGTFYRELYEVTGRSELSRSEFGVSGTVTRLTLHGESHIFGTPREVTVLAVADPVDLAEAPDDVPVTQASIAVANDAASMTPGRTLVLAGRSPEGTAQAEVVTLLSAAATADGRTSVTLTAPPARPYDRATLVLFGNVAKATHGETVQQVLGDGDGRLSFQSFRLAHAPLTYVQSDTPTGSTSTLTVSVDEVAWHEVPTHFGAGPADRSFVTRAEPDGSLAVVTGDGVQGKRLPTGSHNVRASYRKGLGQRGNVSADALSQLLDRPLGVKAVTNPVAATGGADQESEDHARVSIPLPVRTIGRAVSLQDYADFAMAFTGIGLADASVVTLPVGRTIVVTVADTQGAPASASTIAHLTRSLRGHGDPHVRFVVLGHRPVEFHLAMKVRVAPDRETATVFAAVEAALRTAYAPTARRFGEPVHRSAVVAVVASVPGVVAVDLDRLYRGETPGLANRLLAERAKTGPLADPLAAELLALSDGPLDWLQEMP